MRRFNFQPYLFLFIFLFFILSLPPKKINKFRVDCIYTVSKPWHTLKLLQAGFSPSLKNRNELAITKDLELENAQLKKNMENMRHWMLEESRLTDLMEKINFLSSDAKKIFSKDFIERRQKEALRLLKLEAHAIVGQVIYRDPALWSSFIWLNVGEVTNSNLDSIVIAKNSPVLSNGALVGIVEEVYDDCCKVRLITDKRLTPSVRAYRGHEQENYHEENMEILLLFLEEKKELFASDAEAIAFFDTLKRLKSSVKKRAATELLAKGELYGTSKPLWKGASGLLEGIGFNYDFSDEEGPARHLKTGTSLDSSQTTNPIINVGDLLVTTGLDGIFPAGLKVGVVTKIYPLREGACSYGIEAITCETHINSLDKATILPPLKMLMHESP